MFLLDFVATVCNCVYKITIKNIYMYCFILTNLVCFCFGWCLLCRVQREVFNKGWCLARQSAVAGRDGCFFLLSFRISSPPSLHLREVDEVPVRTLFKTPWNK